MVTGSPVLLSLFQWENKNVDLITLGLLIFSIQIQISSDLLCPIILFLRHPTLPHLSMKEFSPEEPKCLKQVVAIVQVLGWLVPVSVRKPNLYVKERYAPVEGITILLPVLSVSWLLTAGMNWLVTSSVWSVSL